MARGTPFLIAVLFAWACLIHVGCTPSSPAQHPAPEATNSTRVEYAVSHKDDEAAFEAVVSNGVPFYLLVINLWFYDDGLEPKHLAGPYKQVMVDQVRKAVPTGFQDEFDRQFPDDDAIMHSIREAEVGFIQALRMSDSLKNVVEEMAGESAEAQVQSSGPRIGSPEVTEAFVQLGRDNVFYRYFLVRHAITLRVGEWMFSEETLGSWLSKNDRAQKLRQLAKYYLENYPEQDLIFKPFDGNEVAKTIGGTIYGYPPNEDRADGLFVMCGRGGSPFASYYLVIFPNTATPYRETKVADGIYVGLHSK
ncbi:MAG: hypothetical protein AAF750_01765 [Planctomycetota bacterium]